MLKKFLRWLGFKDVTMTIYLEGGGVINLECHHFTTQSSMSIATGKLSFTSYSITGCDECINLDLTKIIGVVGKCNFPFQPRWSMTKTPQ